MIYYRIFKECFQPENIETTLYRAIELSYRKAETRLNVTCILDYKLAYLSIDSAVSAYNEYAACNKLAVIRLDFIRIEKIRKHFKKCFNNYLVCNHLDLKLKYSLFY